MDRWTALEVLGLDEDGPTPDVRTVKGRFRTLARQQHPDRGGDPEAFQDLHDAYELLLVELTAEAGRAARRAEPRVARGRPSRDDDSEALARRLDEEEPDERTLELARGLALTGTSRQLSRAPGARTNRFATSLSAASTSSLEITFDRSGQGPTAGATVRVRIELTGRGRAARRALTALDLRAVSEASWARRRGDAITVLETTVTGADRRSVARRAAVITSRLLAALAWPLEEWHGS